MAYTLEEGTKRQHTFTAYIAFMLVILGSGAISYGYTAAIIGTTLGKPFDFSLLLGNKTGFFDFALTWRGRPAIVHQIL